MGKNKPARNAFFFFMLDFKQRTKLANMKDVADAANPHWQKLTAEQRKPYEDRARAEKSGVKYTTTGVNIAVMQKRQEEIMTKIQKMKDNIENTIRVAIVGGRIEHQAFYIVHVNHYGYCNSNKQYIPAELAVSKFTLRDGVTVDSVYNNIVKPGPLPMGYAFQARKAAAETHQIEPELGENAQSNLDQIALEFMRFMTESNTGQGNLPPVYADEKNKDAVENFMKNMCMDSGYDENYIKVYSLEYLFYTLRNAVGDDAQPVYPSIAMAQMELEKDKYDFCKDIPCGYHALSDVPYHCSRSRVIRLAYIICDNCCCDLGIDLIPGQHVPSEAKIVSKRPQSSASGYASTCSSVKEAPQGRNPSRHNPKAHNYYLSQETESVMSMSETNSICDPNDYAALGAYGYDSEYSQVDTEEWVQPRQKHKRKENKPFLPQTSRNSTEPPVGWKADESSHASFSHRSAKPSADVAGGTSTYKQVLSQTSVGSTEPPAELHFTSTSADEYSQPTVSRRPTKLSAVFTEGISQLSLSPSPGLANNILPMGRGRGRGIAANYGKKPS